MDVLNTVYFILFLESNTFLEKIINLQDRRCFTKYLIYFFHYFFYSLFYLKFKIYKPILKYFGQNKDILTEIYILFSF